MSRRPSNTSDSSDKGDERRPTQEETGHTVHRCKPDTPAVRVDMVHLSLSAIRRLTVLAGALWLTLPSGMADANLYHFETAPPSREVGESWTPGQQARYDLNTLNFRRSANEVGPGCSGYISEQPTLELDVEREGQGTIRVESNADPVIIAVSPSGEVFCNDDFSGLNPGLQRQFDRGLWRIWVGSFNEGASFPYTLIME